MHHPLLDAPPTAPVPDNPTAIDHIPDIRRRARPRFTAFEAVLLNALVNAGEGGITITALQSMLAPLSPYGRVAGATIQVHISSIRAKLGEPRHHPEQLLSVRNEKIVAFTSKNGRYYRMYVTGYRWRDTPDAG